MATPGNRITRITSCTFNGTAILGVRSMAYTATKVIKRGQSDGEQGITSADKTFTQVTGYVELVDDSAALTLMSRAVHILVVVGKLAGGTTVTLTIGRTVSSLDSGVLFTRFRKSLPEAGTSGSIRPTRCEFVCRFHPTDTTLDSATVGLLHIA